MTKKFPKIELPFPVRPKKRKDKDWKVGFTGLNLSPGAGFGNPIGGEGAGEGAGVAMGMRESVDDSKSGHVYQYSCAMLNLSQNVAPILQYWCKVNIPKEDLYINEDQGMEGYEDMPHVTILYGLHDVKPKKLISLTHGFGPIELKFDKVTKFDTNPEFDVLKIDIDSAKLLYLNKLISDKMEHTDKFDQYKPHATLAYVKKGTCNHLVNNDFFTSLFDTVDEIYFATKDGDEYFIEL